MDITDFAHHHDDYMQFSPWFDITTWVLQLPIAPPRPEKGVVGSYETRLAEDDEASQEQESMLISLELSSVSSEAQSLRIAGMVVVETHGVRIVECGSSHAWQVYAILIF
jgi:hypothetical protein